MAKLEAAQDDPYASANDGRFPQAGLKFEYSLVPSPRKSGLVHTVCACARIYGKWPVNVFVSEFSHMAMSSTEAVYEYRN